MRNNSTVRLKIVVQDPWIMRMQTEGRDALAQLRYVWMRARQLLCGVRGHRYEMSVQRRRLSLHCHACGHSTVGWDLNDTLPKPNASPDRPRYLELLRKRG